MDSFGKPTKLQLVHVGKRYAPKAVIGIAFRRLTDEILHHGKFGGGEAPGVIGQRRASLITSGEASHEN